MNRAVPVAERIPILNYHAVTDSPEPGIARFAVRPDDLARHLDLMVARDAVVLTVSGLMDLLDRNVAPPAGTALVTFDDGYHDNLTAAAPLLVERGLPATIFVTTGLLPGCPGGTINRPYGAMLPWERLKELEAAGMEVGCHSHSHPQLDLLPKSSASWEIRRSKELLEDALGHPVSSFAYPHGYASRWLQQEVRRLGFRCACGVRNAFSHPHDNRWLLARLTIGSSTSCAEVERFLRGTGASTAPSHELLRTKAWRAGRRARAWVVSSPARPHEVVASNAIPR